MERKKAKGGLKRGAADIGKRVLVLTLAILMTFQFSTASLSGIAFALSEYDEVNELNEAPAEDTAVVEDTTTGDDSSAEEVAEPVDDTGGEALTEEPVQETEESAVQETQEEQTETGDDASGSSDTVEQEEPAASDEAITDESKADEETAAPVKEDAEEETAEETKLNEEQITLYGNANGVDVSVTAEAGTFPEGTDVTVRKIRGEEVSGTVNAALGAAPAKFRAVEITFKDEDGNSVEPQETLTVELKSSALSSGGDLTVVDLDNSVEATDAVQSDDTVTFTTDEGSSTVALAELKAAGEPTRAGEEVEMITVTFDPTTDPDEPQSPDEIEIAKGEVIGGNLPQVPGIAGYETSWVIKGTNTAVTAETVVNAPFTAVVKQGEKITYTVTFVQKDGTQIEKTTDIDSGFAINELPEVTPQTNKVGKWVYEGTTDEFTVGTVVSENLTVEAYYEQNIFTVEYKVDGNHYETLTTAKGTTIVLPTEPTKSGATFKGWFTEPEGEGIQYTAESTVNEDLTLYAYFEGQVRVSFIVKDDNGNVISEKSQYFVDLTTGDKITTFPEDPFIEGKVFDHWAVEDSDPEEIVDSEYTVKNSINAVAVFKEIKTYELTVKYFYMNGDSKVEFQTQLFELTEDDLEDGYTVTAPGNAVADAISGKPTYYPSQPTITVSKDDFTFDETSKKYVYTVEDEYKAADAHYNVGHYLKNLNDEGYSLIETKPGVGVKNAAVTPDINSYAYADFESRDENVTLTGDPDQELKVYYTRRDFTLSYNVNGGDYVAAQTVPYGTSITLPTNATRAGYTFAGWYKDADCTQSAGTTYTLEENTTLYAKWNPAQSNYKIVYMIENANDDDYSYLATVTKQAPTDSSITMTAQTAGANGTRPSELDTTNFTFKDSTTETVHADGTTVVTVRYSRNTYTLQGRNGNSNVNNARVTAKYGADITAAWGSTFGSGNNAQYSWSYNNQNNSKFKSLTIMPSLSVRTNTSPANTIYVYRHDDTAAYYQHLEYWLQNYTDGDATTTYNGKTYGRVKSIDMRYNYLSDVDDWYNITGYTKAGYTATASETQNGTYGDFEYDWGTQFSGYRYYNWGWHYYATYTRFNFYYDAEDYPLTFYNYDGTLISTQDVTLGNDISGYLTSEKPAAPMDGATWLGWFTDQGHTSAYSGGTKMPAGLVLYGAFSFPTRTITFNSQGGTTVEPETDEYGFYATKPADPTREGYTFQGWFTEAGETGSPYDWNQPVKEDTTVYAHWTQNTIGYTVHYYEEGTTTTVLPDKVVSDPSFRQGQVITEEAPSVANHVANNASDTVTLSFDDNANVITFYYSPIPDNITYTVNYVLKDHPDVKVAKSKTVTVPGSTTNVMEMAVEADMAYLATQTEDTDILSKHYRPTVSTQERQLALNNNVITFEYIANTTSKITVNYFDMDGNVIEDPETSYVEVGDTFTVQNKAPDGFVYHHAYLAGTETAPQATYQIDKNTGDLVINIYYQKKLIIIANNKAKLMMVHRLPVQV